MFKNWCFLTKKKQRNLKDTPTKCNCWNWYCYKWTKYVFILLLIGHYLNCLVHKHYFNPTNFFYSYSVLSVTHVRHSTLISGVVTPAAKYLFSQNNLIFKLSKSLSVEESIQLFLLFIQKFLLFFKFHITVCCLWFRLASRSIKD